ncbi:hypothetical protein EYF80_002373 [Liparis tanakae]|uniref:Uncharacterized protein n=1 Tax=Liparis tanakae TaxID=230148 RepID=A0A4Z2JB14_9TELE|nr:hypothetical protein EYF80_002373 [Liparis tanakae]
MYRFVSDHRRTALPSRALRLPITCHVVDLSGQESLLRGFGRRATIGLGRERSRGIWEAEEGWERLCLGVPWLESYSSSEVET